MTSRQTLGFAVNLRLACAAALGLLLVVLAHGAAAVSAQGAPVKPSAPSGGEGIAVHGAWTINVRDPDGTLVERREFRNALTPHGAQRLLRILAADFKFTSQALTPGRWAIGLHFTSEAVPFELNAARLALLHQPGVTGATTDELPSSAAVTATNLRAEYFALGDGDEDYIELNASASAISNGVIDEVRTYLGGCPFEVSPVACRSEPVPYLRTFTTHRLTGAPKTPDAPIHLVPRQVIQAVVKISFAAAPPQTPSQ